METLDKIGCFMNKKYDLSPYLYKSVNIFSDNMSMNGTLKPTLKKDSYRVDVPDYSGYYIFGIENVEEIFDTNVIMIKLKEATHENSR